MYGLEWFLFRTRKLDSLEFVTCLTVTVMLTKSLCIQNVCVHIFCVYYTFMYTLTKHSGTAIIHNIKMYSNKINFLQHFFFLWLNFEFYIWLLVTEEALCCAQDVFYNQAISTKIEHSPRIQI